MADKYSVARDSKGKVVGQFKQDEKGAFSIPVPATDPGFVGFNKTQPVPDDLLTHPPAPAVAPAPTTANTILDKAVGTWTVADCETVLRALLAQKS